jgi:hypothetical protein
VDENLPRPGACTAAQLRTTLEDLLRETEGCALCKLLSRLSYDYAIRFGTTRLRDGERLPGLEAGMGLCNQHLWEVDRNFESPWFADKLLEVLGLLPGRLGFDGVAAHTPEELPLDRERCWACHELTRDETNYVAALARLLEQPGFRAFYEQSCGLCLPHVHALTAAAESEVRAWVLRAESGHWQRLRHDLAELVRKRGPQLRASLTRREDTAPHRCVEKLVGGPGCPWPSELRPRGTGAGRASALPLLSQVFSRESSG